MRGGLVRDHEWAFLLLACAGGSAWGLVSLVVGLSSSFVGSSGLVRVVLTALCLPLEVAQWLGRILRLPAVDPTGLVMASGGLLALIAAAAFLAVLRWRER